MGRIEITKEHVGKKVYAIQTGNNARRGVDRQEIVEFDVVGFGRKYAMVISYGRECGICPKTGAWQESIASGYGGNAGYVFFESPSDAVDYQDELDLRLKALRLLSGFGASSKLSIGLIKKIIAELEA